MRIIPNNNLRIRNNHNNHDILQVPNHCCRLFTLLVAASDSIPPLLPSRFYAFSLYGGGSEDTLPIQQSRLPSYFFPQGISCQDAHSPPFILVVQIQYIFVSVTQQFRPQFLSSLPFYASSFLHSHSFLPFSNWYKNCKISIHFLFWPENRTYWGISQTQSDGCTFSGSRNSHGSAWLFWKPSIIEPNPDLQRATIRGLAYHPPQDLALLGCCI